MASIYDYFGDQEANILAVGNNYETRPEIGPLAGHGIFLKINDENEFEAK